MALFFRVVEKLNNRPHLHKAYYDLYVIFHNVFLAGLDIINHVVKAHAKAKWATVAGYLRLKIREHPRARPPPVNTIPDDAKGFSVALCAALRKIFFLIIFALYHPGEKIKAHNTPSINNNFYFRIQAGQLVFKKTTVT
jgi:hypothetical protein